MIKAHVHVYVVEKMTEVEIEEAVDLVDAKLQALDKAQSGSLSWIESDCRYIGIPFLPSSGY